MPLCRRCYYHLPKPDLRQMVELDPYRCDQCGTYNDLEADPKDIWREVIHRIEVLEAREESRPAIKLSGHP